jgi:hypothetical protein
MASYFRSTLNDFLQTSASELLSDLTLAYARDGFSEMKSDTPLTWWQDLALLRSALSRVADSRPDALGWWVILEFSVPRKKSRLDVVVLAGDQIVILECKSSSATGEAVRQVDSYALLLHYFHKPSDRKKITPLVVTPHEVEESRLQEILHSMMQTELGFDALPSFWIKRPKITSWDALPYLLSSLQTDAKNQLNGANWAEGSYKPTPTIIEAALALRSGLSVGDIAQSEAAEEDIAAVTQEIQRIIQEARRNSKRSIVFLTGVPGSGKTLVGLSLAHLSEDREDAIHFMSGNAPLVSVLQNVFKRHAMQEGVPARNAEIQAETLIEDVHLFAKEYTQKDTIRPPSNHVVVFDEAQRAWDLEQGRRKFGREDSEPTMLLKIMERHEDWACVVALVGGGQEINNGEAGLEEWGKAIEASSAEWSVYASPEVLTGGTSTAGRKLFEHGSKRVEVQTCDLLHLRTSNRSLRADNLAQWVNLVLDGNADEAAALNTRFPIFLTRSLDAARRKLKHESLGDSRYGLVGSSKAERLRAEGLEPDGAFHGGYPWEHWYLEPREDVRSSYACEVFATEFEIQGLELDWTGLCWGGDLIWSGQHWEPRKFWKVGLPRWILTKNQTEQQYRKNSYRVLMTRARQGMVIFVPTGDEHDPTRKPIEMDAVANFLLRCGVHQLSA